MISSKKDIRDVPQYGNILSFIYLSNWDTILKIFVWHGWRRRYVLKRYFPRDFDIPISSWGGQVLLSGHCDFFFLNAKINLHVISLKKKSWEKFLVSFWKYLLYIKTRASNKTESQRSEMRVKHRMS